MRKGRIAIKIRIVTVHGIETMTAIKTAIVTAPAAAGVEGRLADEDPPVRMRILAALAFLLCLTMAAQSQAIDPHALFEEKCGRCHEHAGSFARESLSLEDGELVGRRSGKPVSRTLASHFGKLSDAEADLIVDMLRRQIESGGLYESKCRFCHDPAKDLARQTLIMRNGQLVDRYSGQSVEDLLGYHGRLEDDERTVMLDMLTWQVTIATGARPE